MILYLVYFPPRFASRNSTFFLTDRQFVSLCPYQLCHMHLAHLPTGSYLSMLSGRWVRGRRKVMKKPVMAIDMRRTATVLDFAVVIVNKPSRGIWLCGAYLSSPSCDLEWTMRSIRVSLCVGSMEGERLAGGSGAENFRFGMLVRCSTSRSRPRTILNCTIQMYDILFLKRKMRSLHLRQIGLEFVNRRTNIDGNAQISLQLS